MSLADEIDPRGAYEILEKDPAAAVVDVRTRAEWAFVGLPDLSSISRALLTLEWQRFPDMAVDPDFCTRLDSMLDQVPGPRPEHLLFLCRSGARSMAAAQAVMAAGGASNGLKCTNIAEGFEGELDSEGHRGVVSGWKAVGLPWRQR